MNSVDQCGASAQPLPRICLLTETYYPIVGGGESQARTLAGDLVARGVQVIVLTRRTATAHPSVDRVDGVDVYRIGPIGRSHLARWIMVFTALLALARHAPAFDIAYISGYKALGIAAVIISKLLGKRCILKADSNGELSGAVFEAGLRRLGMTRSTPLFRLLLGARNRILLQADAFVAISEAIARELQAGGVPEGRIHRLPNTVDTRRFAPVSPAAKMELREQLGLPQEGQLVTYTGRLVSYKGLPTLLRVWARLARERPGATLLLVGAGGLDIHNCEAELRSYVEANGLQERVYFTGDVRNVHAYLQASDCFVFPTEKEAFGLSLVEAMACGLPAVTTLTGGIAEFVTPGQNALTVAAGDEQGLGSSLRALLDDPALAARLGDEALKTARGRYDRELVIAGYVSLMCRLTDRGPARTTT